MRLGSGGVCHKPHGSILLNFSLLIVISTAARWDREADYDNADEEGDTAIPTSAASAVGAQPVSPQELLAAVLAALRDGRAWVGLAVQQTV